MSARSSDDFAKFLGSIDRNVILALVPLLGVPFILDSLFSLQPPWPEYSTYATAFLELCTVFIAFFVTIRSKKSLLRWQLSIFAIIAFCFATYFALYSLFVFETPLTGERVIAGFECTANVRDFVAPILRETCPFLSEEVLAAAQYEVEQVWTPASVRLIEIAMFAVWSLFFVATTFLFGISIAILHRSDKRRQAALGRNG